ncbi:MAG: hypothetical protein C4527_18045 [Candidatus Omnitrophota bacterium]|jgi:hypothetical protein|nr:MAG: hypothetical protein C4527_18045 [Candidatus Omnitrophota bacterium]
MMIKPNVLEIARENSENLQRQYEELLAEVETKHVENLKRFTRCIEQDSSVSINMRQEVLLGYLTSNAYHNIYEWVRTRAKRSSKTEEEILREKLGNYYEKRLAFDEYFERGKEFHYGAVTIGGLGAKKYGDYCIVLKDIAPPDTNQTVYLQHDSLNTYMIGNELNIERIRKETAPHSHRHVLVAWKHADEVAEMKEEGWPALLFANEDYVEAIFTKQVSTHDIKVIRMLKLDHDLLFDFTFEDFRGKLNDWERCSTEMFFIMLDQLEKHEIPLEVVNDDYASGR